MKKIFFADYWSIKIIVMDPKVAEIIVVIFAPVF